MLQLCMFGVSYHLKGKDLVNNGLLVDFKGALCEQFVAQELRAMDTIDFGYYTNKNNQGEVDFLVDLEDGVVPVEVKANINLRAKSLKTYMEKYEPTFGYRVSLSDYKKTENLIDFPFYCISEIKRIK